MPFKPYSLIIMQLHKKALKFYKFEDLNAYYQNDTWAEEEMKM